jgi:hypothetical protein
MIKTLRSRCTRLSICAVLANGLAACVVETVPPPPPAPPPPVIVRSYSPLYYQGYVVYYDRHGRPFYYVRGGVRYVPRAHVHYDRYVQHYRRQPRSYERWYEHEGRRHRDDRRPANHPPRRRD